MDNPVDSPVALKDLPKNGSDLRCIRNIRLNQTESACRCFDFPQAGNFGAHRIIPTVDCIPLVPLLLGKKLRPVEQDHTGLILLCQKLGHGEPDASKTSGDDVYPSGS
ncbi:hypothetical protein D3C74_378400 [compost metagenome]